MPRRALILSCLLWLGFAAAQEPPTANDELLHSARLWEARDRGDLARLALEKLIAARPDSPEPLFELGELQLREGNIAEARRILQLLEERFPHSRETRTFATELRVATRDRLQLASIQRLIQLGRGTEARQELDRLFPDGAPDGMYGIEYYLLLARTPGGWESARVGLSRLAARRPHDPRYRLALARHLLDRDATAVQGLRMLHELAQRDDVRARDVQPVLADAIASLGYRRVPAEILRAYRRKNPDDPVAARMLADRAQFDAAIRAFEDTVANDAASEPQRTIARGLRDALLSTPAAARSAKGALAVMRALDAPLQPDARQFDAVTDTALQWARRSLASLRTNAPRAELERDVAAALASGNAESVIAVSERFVAAGDVDTAQRALEDAMRLEPSSAWLFETHVRLLLDRGLYDAAIERLQSRPTDRRWTSAARDELLAVAFDGRARAAQTAGDLARARADFERALELAPDDPWIRYRLANLLVAQGEPERATALMRSAPNRRDPQMAYARGLYFASIDAYAEARAAIAQVPEPARTRDMQELDARVRIAEAREIARTRRNAGDRAAAIAVLESVEPLALVHVDRARDVAYGWIDLDESERALRTFAPYLQEERAHETSVQLAWAEILNAAEDPRLEATLASLRAEPQLKPEERQTVARLQRAFDLRTVRSLQRAGAYEAAAAKLDALLAADPEDRALRVAQADLALSRNQIRVARDRYAALVAEDPDDLDTRLSYVRALTADRSRDLALAQLEYVIERAPAEDLELQLGIARRQLDLGSTEDASRTLDGVLLRAPHRSDALVLAGRAKLAQRDFEGARAFFARADAGTDTAASAQAREALLALDARARDWMEAGIEIRHKPGDPGVSQFDAVIVPTVWSYAHDYDRRFTLRADAISIDAGRLGADYDTAARLGTIQAAGPAAPRPYGNGTEDGLALSLEYATDTFVADVGTTPLGFLLRNVVGGLEWTPDWRGIDFALGVERRAVTSSVLSYAGMRDPISGRTWGGVVETGPYVWAGLYRERFSVAGSVRHMQLRGTNVPNNTFTGVRVATDWKFIARPELEAFVGVTANFWSYERNLQHYTFGHGGYYSPDSYLSVSIPLELQGLWRGWSYRLRVSLSHSDSKVARAPFYPTDAQLQALAETSPLPSGFAAPYYDGGDGGGKSVSAYAAVERRVLPGLVLGMKLDIDRADYYEPTNFMLYLRHAFGKATTRVEIPPRPIAIR